MSALAVVEECGTDIVETKGTVSERVDPLGFMNFSENDLQLREQLFEPEDPYVDCYLLACYGTKKKYAAKLNGGCSLSDEFTLICQLRILEKLLTKTLRCSQITRCFRLSQETVSHILYAIPIFIHVDTFRAILG